MKTRRMGFFGRSLSLVMFVVLLGTTSSLSFAETDRSLYERLGGYDAISAVVDVPTAAEPGEQPGRSNGVQVFLPVISQKH